MVFFEGDATVLICVDALEELVVGQFIWGDSSVGISVRLFKQTGSGS